MESLGMADTGWVFMMVGMAFPVLSVGHCAHSWTLCNAQFFLTSLTSFAGSRGPLFLLLLPPTPKELTDLLEA